MKQTAAVQSPIIRPGASTGLDRTEGGHMGSLQMESFHFASCNKLCQTSTDDEK